jgi:hypothetical protein
MSESEELSPIDSVTDWMTRWILLTGHRSLIAAVITGVLFVIFLVTGFAGYISLSVPDRAVWFLNGTINGLLTLIPIVVGLNQIVLSQQLGSLDDLYDRTKGTFDLHQQIADTTGVAVGSPQVSEFFADLIAAINDRATELEEVADESTNDQLTEDVEDYTETLSEQTDHISSGLEDLGFELIDTLIVLLDYHNSWQLHTTRRLKATYEDDFSETAAETLDELEEMFLELDATRDYLKTLWIQRELTTLSRMMLYTGLPATIVAALGIFIAPEIPALTIARPTIAVLLSATIAVSLLPLSVLLAYTVRIALIAHRTAAFGPFIPQAEQERISGEVTTDSEDDTDD